MKDIQLCGLGNGLVDVQYNATEAQINDIGLKKGEMALVETERQKKVIEYFKNETPNLCSGGSAANTVIAFSQLGGTSAYKTVLGEDEFGDFYAQEFLDLGIILRANRIKAEPTGTCFVLITEDSERTMHTSLGATGLFNVRDIDETLIERAEWLYTEGYKFSAPSSTEALFFAVELAKKHGTKIALTFSDVFIIQNFRENLQKVVRSADLIFCNEQEALTYCQTDDIEKAFEGLCAECPNVVVTFGSKGSRVKWEGKIYEIPSYPATPVDSTGAGDVFAGGFMYGIITTGNAMKAGKLASICGAKVVSQYGARVKTGLTELRDSILNENE